ncbi:MAG: 2-oxoacid:acceptor oxidoreductase family protein [Actinobacteria bacterium]|nr:2-oxoacid:acceptor oxidoreductase family protein [Actinomycetota bacterium]MBU1944784.1 2-oxoacid:acceptor oxidoreductase family protein [Actinomycetota bacterium]MBU2688875.1 2-oxoacid:acceptor oxidoreductase family protein [Actinomycetota bacterium]
MKEIRIHGRGGQGNVTLGEFLAEAAFAGGLYAQAFPMFGSERHGAPVTAYVRISDRPIRLRSQVYEPDHLIVQDMSLFAGNDLTGGLKEGALVVVNTSGPVGDLGIAEGFRVVGVPATELALEVVGKPIINTIMVGAFAGASGEIEMDALEKSVRERYPGELGEREIVAMRRAFEMVQGAVR